MSAAGLAERTKAPELEESALEYLARIKIHPPTDAGVLVELNGEFDLSCLEAFATALDRATAPGKAVFVDLSGVNFMDALCTRELLRKAEGPGRFELCEPSPEANLSAAALGHWEGMRACAADDPAYEAVIREACRPKLEEDGARRTNRNLYTTTSLNAGR